MKEIKMFKNGEWVRWDGSDQKQLIIEEKITMEQFKEQLPEQWGLIRKLRKQ